MPILYANYSKLDHEEVALSIGIKPKYIPMLIASFIDESKQILDLLKESIESKNYDNIRSCAHSIKGSAGNIKFNEIYEMAKEMEIAAKEENSDFEYMQYLDAIKNIIKTM
jgi:HPt (histidine-containing phosphotransfer) domain-containing protein